ncbi:hypothetical protein Save01_01346 [Streptomyces avermitilis]
MTKRVPVPTASGGTGTLPGIRPALTAEAHLTPAVTVARTATFPL